VGLALVFVADDEAELVVAGVGGDAVGKRRHSVAKSPVLRSGMTSRRRGRPAVPAAGPPPAGPEGAVEALVKPLGRVRPVNTVLDG
jgi:hypothetical protein